MTGCKKDAGAAGKLTWQGLLYAAAPAFLYTALSNAVHTLLAASGRFSSGIRLQAVSVSVCLFVFSWYAVRVRLAVRDTDKRRDMYRYPVAFCYVMAVVMCGVVNNYLFSIIMSVVRDFSSGYFEVVKVFYTKDLWMEILTLCIIGPAAEELVYRGFVYQRLRERGSQEAAAVWSALLFGLMHFNLVQGVYAFVLGILLAHITERTGGLATAAAAHMVANLVSVLWTETDWLDILNQSGSRQYAAALICLALMGIFLSYGNRMMRLEKKQGMGQKRIK